MPAPWTDPQKCSRDSPPPQKAPQPEFTRRRFLVVPPRDGVGAAAALLPTSVQKALATPPNGRAVERHQARVLLMQGTARSTTTTDAVGVAGFDDARDHALDRQSVFYQPDAGTGRLPAAVPPRHAQHELAGHPSTSHAYSCSTSPERRQDGQWLRPIGRRQGNGRMSWATNPRTCRSSTPGDAFTSATTTSSCRARPGQPLYWMSGTNARTRPRGPITSNSLPNGPYTWTT